MFRVEIRSGVEGPGRLLEALACQAETLRGGAFLLGAEDRVNGSHVKKDRGQLEVDMFWRHGISLVDVGPEEEEKPASLRIGEWMKG